MSKEKENNIKCLHFSYKNKQNQYTVIKDTAAGCEANQAAYFHFMTHCSPSATPLWPWRLELMAQAMLHEKAHT